MYAFKIHNFINGKQKEQSGKVSLILCSKIFITKDYMLIKKYVLKIYDCITT